MTNEPIDRLSELEQELRRLEDQKAGTYEQRTRHKDPQNRPLFINRLIREDSPYLLQHAHNPVNWYAWSDEAFDTARGENKPIFLSIGYSTCHWCHVMEAESFDNTEVATLLNRSFICIKLDREQFPDIDEIYMTGVQIMTGQGGWPMSNFLLPDGNPFYSATYFPPQQFMGLLAQITAVWQEKRADLEQSAAKIRTAIEQILQGKQETRALDMPAIESAADEILSRQDKTFGGLAGAPKFPQEPLLFYFLEGSQRYRDVDKAAFSMRALDAMARGGIYDQVAGGFHRYSTDANWLVPHFEKMLYNQSQLSQVYLTAWQLTGNRFFRRIVRQTLDYVIREMQTPQGGFYSATDADSEDQEGLYFIWTIEQLAKLLTKQELALCHQLYDLSETGNFESANILALKPDLAQFTTPGPSVEFESKLDKLLLKLRIARETRVPPLRDDKLIVAWSAAMTNSLAWAGHELGEPDYIQCAEKAANFMWETNYAAQSSLHRIFLNGFVSIPAQLEDYANFSSALITLFDITRKPQYLHRAAELMANAIALFWNEKSAGFFLSQELESGPKLARSSSASDNATLSAYGTALDCLVALAHRKLLFDVPELTDEVPLQEKINQCVNALSAAVADHPANHSTAIRAINHLRQGSVSSIQYAGEGQLRVSIKPVKPSPGKDHDQQISVVLAFDLMTGVHITATAAENTEFVPLNLALALNEQHWKIVRQVNPDSVAMPEDTTTQVYEGSFEVELILEPTDQATDLLSNSIGLTLAVQLCTENLCLPLDTLNFRI